MKLDRTFYVFFVILTFLYFSALSAEEKIKETELATFAGGCFWCLQHTFNDTLGVIKTLSGYSGGKEKNPRYDQVASGLTSHTESLQVEFDPKLVSYEKLVRIFFSEHDPYDDQGQFCDRGSQYRPVVFTHNPKQEEFVKSYISALSRANEVKTAIVTFEAFYPAEEYHQNFYRKNPGRYQQYRLGCGRDRRLSEIKEMKSK